MSVSSRARSSATSPRIARDLFRLQRLRCGVDPVGELQLAADLLAQARERGLESFGQEDVDGVGSDFGGREMARIERRHEAFDDRFDGGARGQLGSSPFL